MTKLGTPRRSGRGTKRMGAESDRYAPAQRLHDLRTFLNASGGVSIYDVAERFEVSARTAIRYLNALRRAGEPLFDEVVGKRKVWRLMPTATAKSWRRRRWSVWSGHRTGFRPSEDGAARSPVRRQRMA